MSEALQAIADHVGTRIGSALDYTLAQMPDGRAARILVLTDGYATEPLGPSADAPSRAKAALTWCTEISSLFTRAATWEAPCSFLSPAQAETRKTAMRKAEMRNALIAI